MKILMTCLLAFRLWFEKDSHLLTRVSPHQQRVMNVLFVFKCSGARIF
jgi:hypothetical protein